jgi:hypothetical protein
MKFTYDSRNRLTDAVYAAYTYDANNIRVAMTENGITRRFVVNPNALLSEFLVETDGQGNPKAYYVYGLGLISRETPAGDYSVYHYDLRGSTVALTNLNGGRGIITRRLSLCRVIRLHCSVELRFKFLKGPMFVDLLCMNPYETSG